MLRVLPMLLLAGCDLDFIPDAFRLDEDELDDLAAARGCEDLEGRFRARDFAFEGLDDPGLFEDFPGADFTLDITGPQFTSTFAGPGAAAVDLVGTVDPFEDEIVFGDNPFLPGVQGRDVTLLCRVDDGVLILEGDRVGFDFEGTGLFEPATFSGTFTPL